MPLRLNAKLYDALAAWAEDDFRSVNGQIEYLLTECVRQRKKNGKYVSDQLDVRQNWISIKTRAVNVNYEIRPLHKTGAAACCLSGKGGAFRRERKQIKANLIVQLIVQCSGISSEKATKVAKKS